MDKRVKTNRYKKYDKKPFFTMDKFKCGETYTGNKNMYHEDWGHKTVVRNIKRRKK
jgi:hypothetical protein